MSFVKPEALKPLRGAALFYPSAGNDYYEPLEFFAPVITEFWFVDVAYFTRQSADAVEPLFPHSALMQFQRFSLEGPPIVQFEFRVDASGTSYPFIEPCTRSEFYRHRPTNTIIAVHRRRGFGQRLISALFS